MKNSITLFIALLFIQSTILATTDKAKFNATKNIKAAEKAMEVGDVYQAADLYDEVLQNDQKNKAVAYKLGMLYFGFRDYKNAERCFQMAIGENVTSSAPLAGYYYALMQKMNGKYPEAKKSFEAFKKSYKGSFILSDIGMSFNISSSGKWCWNLMQSAPAIFALKAISFPNSVEPKCWSPASAIMNTLVINEILIYMSK